MNSSIQTSPCLPRFLSTLTVAALIVTAAVAADNPPVNAVATTGPAGDRNGMTPLSPAVSDIVKMVKAKVDPGVIETYINASPNAYNPNAGEIITLKNLGVPDQLVTALVRHGAEARAQGAQAALPAQTASMTTPSGPPAAYASAPPMSPYDYGDYGVSSYAYPYDYGSPYYYPYSYPYSYSYSYGFPFYSSFFLNYGFYGGRHHGFYAHRYPSWNRGFHAFGNHAFGSRGGAWAPVSGFGRHSGGFSAGNWRSPGGFGHAGAFGGHSGGFSGRSSGFSGRSGGFAVHGGFGGRGGGGGHSGRR
jgi:hypothetical protein